MDVALLFLIALQRAENNEMTMRQIADAVGLVELTDWRKLMDILDTYDGKLWHVGGFYGLDTVIITLIESEG